MGLMNRLGLSKSNQAVGGASINIRQGETIFARLEEIRINLNKGQVDLGGGFDELGNKIYRLIVDIDNYNKGIHTANRWKEDAAGYLNEIYMRKYRFIKTSFDMLSQKITANLKMLDNPLEKREAVAKKLKEMRIELAGLSERLNSNSFSPHYRFVMGDRDIKNKYSELGTEMKNSIDVLNSKNL